MTSDELEFAIAQYTDGTLPAGERAALEARLAADADARALLDEYRAVDATLKGPAVPEFQWDRLAEQISGAVAAADQVAVAEDEALDAALKGLVVADPLPAVRWDALAAHISAAVAAHAATPGELPEDVEFTVAQYADGTLAADQRQVVEAHLESDARARLVLADYARVDAGLRHVAADRPAVRWAALADHLSGAVDREVAAADEAKRERFRIGAWVRRPAWLAAAASVLLAVGIAVRVAQPPVADTGTGGPTLLPPPPVVTVVNIGNVEAPQGEAVAEIQIGPMAEGGNTAIVDSGFIDDLVTRPSRTIVASGVPAPPDKFLVLAPF